MDIEKLKTATEQELRDIEIDFVETLDELKSIIGALADRKHDYGTCVYAMSIASYATFRYIAHQLGVTGFQASCADLDFLRRTRRMESGFRIINYEDLLYPQYQDDFPTWDRLIDENRKHLAKMAKEKLDTVDEPHPEVKAYWEWLVSLEDKIDEDS